MSKRRKGKIGKSVLVKGAVICFAMVVISFSLIPGLAAQGTGDTVNVTVNAPEMAKVGDTFNASIDVDSVTNFNSGQFDLTFDSSVVNVTAVESGCIDETEIPIGKDKWEFMDNDRIRVLPEVPGVIGVNGSGNLATISFAVLGKGGDKSRLDISNGILYNNEAEKIPAEWIDDEIIVGPVKVEVNAPEFADAGGTFTATIDVVDEVANFNTAVFDLTFDSSAVNVTNVTDGSLDGTAIPITSWDFIDSNTIKVMCELSGVTGVNGSGNIATISFEVLGIGGDRSVLEITNRMLANNEADEIPATWVDDKVIVGPVKVEVNAPEFADAGGTFTATIDVMDDVANFNMAVFDLTFDSSAVNVTDVTDGSMGGTAIPITSWDFIDSNTIKVMCELSGVTGVNGSGNIATISFEVLGIGGDRSVLEITNGMLANNEADEIPATWVDDKVIVGPVKVEVNAPEFADAGGTFTATIDVMDDVANFNMAVFDLTFDSSAVNVTDVTDGSMGGTAIPITSWDFIDSNTIKVMCELSGVTGVNGSGNIATISFEVLGIGGDRSVLAITNGMLANNEADEIPATWVDDKVIVGPVKMEVNAPEFADAGGTFTATIDVMEDVANFNMAVFDLTFDSSAVNVTDVTDGSMDGTAIPITSWDFIDSSTIKVMCELSGVTGVNGTGNIATISFEVLGNAGDKSVLEISDGMLGNNEAEEIPAVWVADEVTVK